MNVYIVDDEPLARAELRYLLEQTGLVTVCGESEGLEELCQEFKFVEVDCIFLDIELGGSNGVDLAKELMLNTQIPEIIFATAYDEYALQAFEVNAFDYILKPFEAQRVQTAVEKLVAKKEQDRQKQSKN